MVPGTEHTLPQNMLQASVKGTVTVSLLRMLTLMILLLLHLKLIWHRILLQMPLQQPLQTIKPISLLLPPLWILFKTEDNRYASLQSYLSVPTMHNTIQHQNLQSLLHIIPLTSRSIQIRLLLRLHPHL
jgi:hypothetical protein